VKEMNRARFRPTATLTHYAAQCIDPEWMVDYSSKGRIADGYRAPMEGWHVIS
jgi:hypothetical protein